MELHQIACLPRKEYKSCKEPKSICVRDKYTQIDLVKSRVLGLSFLFATVTFGKLPEISSRRKSRDFLCEAPEVDLSLDLTRETSVC
jgi:hypothetical protein